MIPSIEVLVNTGAFAVLGGAILGLGTCHAERAGVRMAYLAALVVGLVAVTLLAALEASGG